MFDMTSEPDELHARAVSFVDKYIAPCASQIDATGNTPPDLISIMRSSSYLGAALPKEWGGGGVDPVLHGLITEEFGNACSSIRSLLTVHNMSAQALGRHGTPEQRKRWMPEICNGGLILAFALTEDVAGSSANAIQSTAVAHGSELCINGTKRWITYGQVADLFLVFAKGEHGPVALLVERDRPGVTISPIRDAFGTRGSMLAEVVFDQVSVPKTHQVGPDGAGINFVANTALDHGRFSVAWGCVGILRACLDASVLYAQKREQGGQLLKDHQLIRRLLADMLVDYRAAKEVCLRVSAMRKNKAPQSTMETSLAKYLASTSAVRVATNALHLHGANGCSPGFSLSRLLRDATVMSIIEGTDEIHQIALGGYALQRPYLSTPSIDPILDKGR